MTTQAPDTADFVGLEAVVEDIKPYRKGEESARFKVVVSLPFRGNADLMGALTGQLKNVVFVGFGFMQAPLNFPSTAPGGTVSNAIPTPDPAPVQTGDGIPHMTDSNGDVVLPHNYKGDRNDRTRCLICDAPAGHDIHSKAALKARDAMAKAKKTPAELAADGEAMHQRFAEAYKTAHAFEPRTEDDACGACGHPDADAVHQPSVAVDSIPEHLQNGNGNGLAGKLIADAAHTDAVTA